MGNVVVQCLWCGRQFDTPNWSEERKVPDHRQGEGDRRGRQCPGASAPGAIVRAKVKATGK